jgi:hypothetical protein
MKNTQKTSPMTIILRIVIAVATTLLGIVGGSEAYAMLMN